MLEKKVVLKRSTCKNILQLTTVNRQQVRNMIGFKKRILESFSGVKMGRSSLTCIYLEIVEQKKTNLKLSKIFHHQQHRKASEDYGSQEKSLCATKKARISIGSLRF